MPSRVLERTIFSIFVTFCYDRRPASFWHFLWLWNCDFFAFCSDRRPVSFWYFLCQRMCEFLAFLVTANLLVFGIFSDHGLASFCHFLWPWTCEFLAFHKLSGSWSEKNTKNSHIRYQRRMPITHMSAVGKMSFFWPRNCEFLNF